MKQIFFMAGLFSFITGIFPLNVNAESYQVAEIYSDLRNKIFNAKPNNFGTKLKEPNEVWGILMETGYPKAVVSLVALADGTVSIYFSNGGGIIGLGLQDGPRRAAQLFLASAQQYSMHMQQTNTYPLPKLSYTRFYLLARDGVLTAEVKEEDLGNNRHPLSPLFYKGQELISEIRDADQKFRIEKNTQEGHPIVKQ